MQESFRYIDLRVPHRRFESWSHFIAATPPYSIGLEVIDDIPGRRANRIHFDHHSGVIREATMSAGMQAYIAVRQGGLMQRWLTHRCPLPVYVWNADQDVCLASFILEYHQLLEQFHSDPLLRWIVQFNNKVDVCGGLYPVDLDELVRNHFTWVFEPFREQRMKGKMDGDEALIRRTIRQVCDRLEALLQGRAGVSPIVAEPEILYTSPLGFVIVDEKGDPNSRLVLAARGYAHVISLICRRKSGRYTYSVLRGSPYDEDTFHVLELTRAFQAAEDQPGAKIWGGSTLAAGSDSELGSSLHWTQLRDIAEAVVGKAARARAAYASQETAAPRDTTPPRDTAPPETTALCEATAPGSTAPRDTTTSRVNAPPETTALCEASAPGGTAPRDTRAPRDTIASSDTVPPETTALCEATAPGSTAPRDTAPPRDTAAPRILVAMPPGDAARLQAVLDQCGAESLAASSCAEVARLLRDAAPIGAMFSTSRLPDGGFHELAGLGKLCHDPVPLIVCLPRIDGSWIDVLEAGAFDVVVEPYRREAIQRIISELPLYKRAPALAVG